MKKSISIFWFMLILLSATKSYAQTDYPTNAFGIQDLFRTWNNRTQSYSGPALALATMADHSTCSWGNSGMKDLSSEPRMPFNNDQSYSYAYITERFWNDMYQNIDTANFLLAEIGTTINFGTGGDFNEFAIAWAHFNRGIAYGYLGLIFDKGLLYTAPDVDKLSLPFYPFSDIIESALDDLEIAAAGFDAATGQDLPDGWINGIYFSNFEMAELSRSFIARLLTYSARNSSQTIDWARVSANTQNGLQTNLEPVMVNNIWENDLMGYIGYPSWLRVDHRIINLMDSNYPYRWPYDNTSWDTPGGNDPGPATPEDQRLLSDFTFDASNNFIPSRGYYHFSHYRYSRYDDYMNNAWTGPSSIFSSWETDLLLTESLVNLGDNAGAISILNNPANPRITRGGLAPLSGGETTQELLEVIFHERDVELIGTGMGITFFDMRRKDALQKGTPLHFPVPGAVLTARSESLYTFGGEINADGLNTALGDKSWDDGFYFTIEKGSCDYGVNDWQITMVPPLSNPPYEYSIDNGATFSTNNVFTGLANGMYYMRVKDNLNDTSFLKTVDLDTLKMSLKKSYNSCYQEDNGYISVTVSGGIKPYSYLWSNGETGNVISNVPPGIYNLTVTDAIGCSFFVSDTIYEEAEIITPDIHGPATVEYYSKDWFWVTETEGAEYFWDCQEGQILQNLNDSVLVQWINPVDSIHISVRASINGCYSLTESLTIAQGSIMQNSLSLFNEWLNTVESYYGPGMAMGVMADQHTSSWGNSGMKDLSSEPRNEYNNSPSYSYYYLTERYWNSLYEVIHQSRDILLQLDSIPDDPDNPEYKIMMEAWAYFNLGISHGYLGLVFDKAHIIDKNTDLNNLSFNTYTDVVAASVSFLDQCIVLCNQNNFSLPDEFLSSEISIDNSMLEQMANSMASRLLVYQSRNQTLNTSLNWAAVLNYANNGISYDLNILYENYSSANITRYLNLPGWCRIDYRIIHLMDPGYPYRWPDDNVSWDTQDGLDPMEANSMDARLINDFEYNQTVPFHPDRGYYHFSHYRFKRYDEYVNSSAGPKPIFLKAELDLIMAEAYLNMGNNAAAVDILNNGSRINRGNLPALTGGETNQELLKATFYERDIELISSSMGIGFFDLRRRDMHQKGTPLHFPVPATILNDLGEEVYTYGAEFRADGWNTADGTQAWDSAIYINIDKEACAGTDNWILEIEVTDGFAPHQYSINGGSYQSLNIFTGLTTGEYIIAVMNSKGEVKTKEVYIEELGADSYHQDICFESEGGGIIYLYISGGIPAYSYLWSDGSTSRDLLNAPSGIYTVEITDEVGCSVFIEDTIYDIPEIIVSPILGSTQVDPGSQQIYYVEPNEGAYFYYWGAYGGNIVGFSGEYDDSVTVTWDNPMPDSAYIFVLERNIQGCSSEREYLYINLPEPDLHFVPVWEGNGVDHMNFYAVTASLDEEDLQPGDEIAVFDGDYCVGVGVIEEVLVEGVNYLSFVASKNDAVFPVVNGFTPGNNVSFRVWDVSEEREIDRVNVTYLTGDGTFSIGGSATFHLSANSQVEQLISLDNGWNIMSFYMIPDDLTMQTILQALIDGGSLIKVQDETGQAIENVVPIGWIYNIDQMANTEGYKIKVNGNVNLSSTGFEVELPYNIPLDDGWNIMAYPAMQSQSAISALDLLINEGSLIKVQNEQGQAIENVVPIGWVDNIGNFVPGEGYKIKVNQNTLITVNASFKKSMHVKGSLPTPKHFIPVWDGNGLDHMNFYVTSATLGEVPLKVGDEIGVFSGQQCVGYGVVTRNNLISLIASLDDPTTPEKDGFEEGESIELRAWIAANDQEVPMIELVIVPGYPSLFEKMGTTVLEARFDPTGLLQTTLSIYPNPFTYKTNITLMLGNTSDVSLSIYNIMGKKITSLADETMPAGTHTFVWDGTDGLSNKVAPGTYLLKIIAGDYVKINKLVIK